MLLAAVAASGPGIGPGASRSAAGELSDATLHQALSAKPRRLTWWRLREGILSRPG